MFYSVKDIQKFLLGKQIFWDGNIYDSLGKWRKAAELDINNNISGVSCTLVCMDSDETEKKDVNMIVDDYHFEIIKERHYHGEDYSTTLYDFSKDWIKYRLNVPEFAKKVIDFSQARESFLSKKMDREVKELEEKIAKVKNDNIKQIDFWRDIRNRAIVEVKYQQNNKTID